jgi:alpha-L-rhamnosidase
MKQTGTFVCSNPLINQLQHNIQWGQKGNFLDVPTDCPQRDERLGWTGDAQVFSRTAAFNMNVNNFFSKWLKDLAADQKPGGEVPFVIPDLFKDTTMSSGWSDAATVIPWNIYLVYGDKRILEQQYASMKSWVEYMRRNSKNDLWSPSFGFGDWLFYSMADDPFGRSAITEQTLIAQCFYANSVQMLINASNVLSRKDVSRKDAMDDEDAKVYKEDVKAYTELHQRIKNAFVREYVTGSGRLVSGSQTAYVLALNFDMLPEKMRQQAAARLVENIHSYNNHITTGFLGTPYICHVLSRFGYTNVAYQLLLQETYPSWLYPVKMGATTIWERWDGIKPDSTFQTPVMNSFNHYAYGVIGDWMYRVTAGINTDDEDVAYHHIIIKPQIGGGLTQAAASVDTYYGRVSCGWKIDSGGFTLEVEVPVNTTADVFIPVFMNEEVLEDKKSIKGRKDIRLIMEDSNYVQVKVGSGRYNF